MRSAIRRDGGRGLSPLESDRAVDDRKGDDLLGLEHLLLERLERLAGLRAGEELVLLDEGRHGADRLDLERSQSDHKTTSVSIGPPCEVD